MLREFAIILALLLSACADDVRGIRLEEVDLSDTAAVREIAGQLSSTDRAALLTYAALHAPSSPGFCGKRLVGASGKEPATIGEAIELTLGLQAGTPSASSEPDVAKTPAQRAGEQWDDLIIQRELVISRQSALLAEHGSAARRLREWSSLETAMRAYDQKLAVLKARMEGNATS